MGLGACSGPLSTLDPAGPSAQSVSVLSWIMLVFLTLVLAAVTALWLYAVYRQPTPAAQGIDLADNDSKLTRQHAVWIIGGGLVFPTVSMLILLAVSIPVGNLMSGLPSEADQALRIQVTAHQWRWQIDYLDGTSDNNLASTQNALHIPVNAPVHLYLSSADVIHSFWVPRLAGKLDMIPGRTNELRIQADEPGVYPGLCAEFCGLAHATMRFAVHVHSRDDFNQWIDSQRQQVDTVRLELLQGEVPSGE